MIIMDINLFWWPNLFKDVKLFIQKCHICNRVKPLGKKKPYVGVREWPTKPLELVSIDYLAELPPSARNNNHLLVINDQSSKLIQVHAIKDRTSKTAGKCLIGYCLRSGMPVKLYPDKNPSEAFQYLM